MNDNRDRMNMYVRNNSLITYITQRLKLELSGLATDIKSNSACAFIG